jgi:hypothetical protein
MVVGFAWLLTVDQQCQDDHLQNADAFSGRQSCHKSTGAFSNGERAKTLSMRPAHQSKPTYCKQNGPDRISGSIPAIQELQNEDEEVDDIEVELNRCDYIVVRTQPLVDHVCICRACTHVPHHAESAMQDDTSE